MPKLPVVVLISDVHYNLNTITVADQAMAAALKKAESLTVPLIVAGDIHDTKAIVRAECMSAMIQTFRNSPVRKIVLVGNHCLVNEKSDKNALDFLKPYCELVESASYDEALNLWFIPYKSDATEFENFVSKIPQGSVVIAHQGFRGAKMGHYLIDNSSIPLNSVSHVRVFSGHYHIHQTVGTVTYIGNPYTLNFGEANDPVKGFIILYSDGSFEYVYLNLRRHIVIDIEFAQLNKLNNLKLSKEDLLWLKVYGSQRELNSFKKSDIKKLAECNFKLDLIPTANEISSQDLAVEKSNESLMDDLIEGIPESQEFKSLVKSAWRKILS